jgi:hypothetical protein
MSKIALSGNASGTGTFTIASPDSSTDRTVNLPDAGGDMVLTTATQTLTNKSIVATQLTGTVAAARLPAGSVLQVVQGTTSTSTTTTSTAFQSTGLTASITPSSASSKILVIATSTFVGTTLTDVLTTIFRGDTSTGVNVSGGNLSTKYNNQGSENASVTNQYLDSPSTTSSQTYTFAFRSSVSGQTSTAQSGGVIAVITLMEIAA